MPSWFLLGILRIFLGIFSWISRGNIEFLQWLLQRIPSEIQLPLNSFNKFIGRIFVKKICRNFRRITKRILEEIPERITREILWGILGPVAGKKNPAGVLIFFFIFFPLKELLKASQEGFLEEVHVKSLELLLEKYI